MKRILLVVVLLTACTTSGGQKRYMESSCASASAAIKVLAVANEQGKLSDAQEAQVDKAIGVVQPICNASPKPMLDEVKKQAFAAALNVLNVSALLHGEQE